MTYSGIEIWKENGKYRLLDPKDGKVRIFSDEKYIKPYIDMRLDERKPGRPAVTITCKR